MIKVLKKYLLIMILFYQVPQSISQQSLGVYIRSGSGIALKVIDSLSFKDPMSSSLYYCDSVNGQSYTGKAVVYFGKNRLDSLDLSNGYLNGWKKSYWVKSQELELNDIEFTDQSEKINISYLVQSPPKTRSAFVRYYTDSTYYFHEVKYKPSGKIIVLQNRQTRNNKTKKRLKFKSLDELDCFFSRHSKVYQYCKLIGLFSNSR